MAARASKLTAHVSKETQLAMTCNMPGTIFAGSARTWVCPARSTGNPPIRYDDAVQHAAAPGEVFGGGGACRRG
jgi:hypothetical protein